MSEATCETCPWWARLPDDVEYGLREVGAEGLAPRREASKVGECRQSPPMPFQVGDEIGHLFAVTRFDDWCGEHPDRRRRLHSS
jgi:hypothetical protein